MITSLVEGRKAIAESYLTAVDAGGVLPTTGLGLFDHVTDDAEVYFPKWGEVRDLEQVKQLFPDVGGSLKAITHHDDFTLYLNGTDKFAVEGTSHGTHRDGPWKAGTPEWAARRWCDTFHLRDGKIARPYTYLDPGCAGQDHARNPWIKA